MARRKRQLLEDDDSDSSSGEDNDIEDVGYADDPDTRAERELFENPYKHKRRRKNGKEDAIYGVFGSDDEEEDYNDKRGGKAGKRSDWTKAPAFNAGEKVELNKALDEDETMEDAETSEDSDGEDAAEDEELSDTAQDDATGSEPSNVPTPDIPDILEEQGEERPRFGGLGLGAPKAGLGIGAAKAGLGAPKAGIGSSSKSAFSGFSKGGIGSFKLSSTIETLPPASPSPASETHPVVTEDFPSAFGKQARPQRAFVRDGSAGSGASTPKPVNLTATERAHFSKISGTFGARMLEKMGWQAGTGLGTAGEGIVTPVESKLRPKGMGLAFKGFNEKTAQSKAEARRRGEVVSDDEEDPRQKKGRKPKARDQQERSDAWKKPKKTKKKVEHKTYEQIIAEAGQEAPAAGMGQIIDATGATVSDTLISLNSNLIIIIFSFAKYRLWPTFRWPLGRQQLTPCVFPKFATISV
jgi:tuftelin-interacting protein 11